MISEKVNEIAAEVGNGQEKTHRGRQGGRVAGFAYLRTPKDARLFLTRVVNLMVVGDVKDPRYQRDLQAWGQLQEPKGEPPEPPKLEPKVVTATANAIRTWLELKDNELEALLKEVNETNRKLLDIIAASERQTAVAGHSHTE